MVHAHVEGIVMEKVTAKKQGSNDEKLQLRIFQRGNKDLVNATVGSKTFGTVKEGDKVAIVVKIDLWQNDGSYGLYCSEAFSN